MRNLREPSFNLRFKLYLEVPVALAVEDEVLDVDWQLAPAADLRGGLGPAFLRRHARRHAAGVGNIIFEGRGKISRNFVDLLPLAL